MNGPAVLDGVGLAAAIRSGERSAAEVVEDALNRIEALDPTLGAFTVTFAEAARAQAQVADRRVAAGGRLPPMLGVPVSVKDHIWLAGELATNGSLAYREFRPAEDCVAVRRLRAAGAIIVGKTNNPEFCYRGFTDNRVFGLTRNPWRLDRTPGGSSGGAGACVAAGMTPLGLGTDGGGSIRIPASFCGVVGHKPVPSLVECRWMMLEIAYDPPNRWSLRVEACELLTAIYGRIADFLRTLCGLIKIDLPASAQGQLPRVVSSGWFARWPGTGLTLILQPDRCGASCRNTEVPCLQGKIVIAEVRFPAQRGHPQGECYRLAVRCRG